MLSSKKLAVVIAAAVAVIVPIIMAAASPETLCSSDLSGMVNRNIKVDGPCAIDATVNGNIILDGSDDSIRLFNGTVDGNVEAKDSFRVEIGTGTEINGNLKLQNTTSTVIGEAIVRGNVEAIDGDLHVLPGAEIFGKVKHEGSGVCVVAPDAKVHGGIEGCLTSDGT